MLWAGRKNIVFRVSNKITIASAPRHATMVEVENNVAGSVALVLAAVLTSAQLCSAVRDGREAQSSSNGRKAMKLRGMEQKGVMVVLTELLGTCFEEVTCTAAMPQKWIKG